MADDVFKLPQSSYDMLCKIIMSYAQVGDRTSLSTISKIVGSDSTVISRNVGFLVGVGLLEGGRDKGVTMEGARLGRALQFSEIDDIARAWRDVLAPAPLVQRILSAIRVRGGMDSSTLQTQIVYTAGVNKTSGTLAGGGAIIEMLKAANLIVEREGKFIAPTVVDAVGASAEPETEVETPPIFERRLVDSVTEASGVSLSVEVQIRVVANPDELEGLGMQLRAMLETLQSAGQPNDAQISEPQQS